MHARSTLLTAECVNGVVIANSDNLVTWAFKALDDVDRRGNALASLKDESAVLTADGIRVPWNCSRRARVVERTVDSCFDILLSVMKALLLK